MTNKIDQSLLNPFQVTKNRSYKNHQKLNFLICRLSSKQTQLPKNSQKIAFNAPNRTKNIMPTKHKKQKKRYLIEEYIYPSKRIPRSMESRKKDRSSRTSATARSPLDKWSSPDAAGCENRKSDWPVRKRAEQKHHAEFSVGRSSIIGAEYRSGYHQIHLPACEAFPVSSLSPFHSPFRPSLPLLSCSWPVSLPPWHSLCLFPAGISPRATLLISPTDIAIFTAASRPDRGRYQEYRDNARLLAAPQVRVENDSGEGGGRVEGLRFGGWMRKNWRFQRVLRDLSSCVGRLGSNAELLGKLD